MGQGWRMALFAAGAVAAWSAPARADYPDKQITMVVCFPAGGGTDIAARLINTQLGEALGKPVIIENRGGAGGKHRHPGGEAAAGLFRTFWISTADDANQVANCVIRGSDRFLAVRPGGNRLANDFRRGEALPTGQTRNALAGFWVEPKCEWRCHLKLHARKNVTRLVIQIALNQVDADAAAYHGGRPLKTRKGDVVFGTE